MKLMNNGIVQFVTFKNRHNNPPSRKKKTFPNERMVIWNVCPQWITEYVTKNLPDWSVKEIYICTVLGIGRNQIITSGKCIMCTEIETTKWGIKTLCKVVQSSIGKTLLPVCLIPWYGA